LPPRYPHDPPFDVLLPVGSEFGGHTVGTNGISTDEISGPQPW